MEKGKDGEKILVDNVVGREDETEEEIEMETEMHKSKDPWLECIEAKDPWSKWTTDKGAGWGDEMEEKIETETEMQDPDSIQDLLMKMLTLSASMKEKMATKADFEPSKDMANEFETESETETENNPTREDAQPVRAVRVPAHQISDRKFVKVERKRRKRKEQTDCKTS